MYEDKTLVCKDCGQEFTFTAGEQEFYAEKGFTNEPQRCKACRDARKAANGGAKAARQMYDAVCASCGQTARFLSSLAMTVRSTAANASRIDKYSETKNPLRGIFCFFI